MAIENKDERRVFVIEGEESKTYYVSPPTAEDVRGADWQYSKVYTKALIEGITTSAEMMNILLRRGIAGPEFDRRQQELQEEINEVTMQLRVAMDNTDKQMLAVKLATTRDELLNWNQRVNGPMTNTCERMADDSRLEFLTSCMVQDDAGHKVWESYDKYLTDRNRDLALRARFETMLYLQNIDSDFLDKTPEAVAFREIEADLRTQADAAIEASKAVEVGETVEDAKEKKKKK
jgi:hypothetical protein